VVFSHRVAQAVECGEETDLDLAWWNQNSKCVYQEAFRNLDRALRDYDKLPGFLPLFHRDDPLF
jgi:hypothetical protein